MDIFAVAWDALAARRDLVGPDWWPPEAANGSSRA